MGGIGEEPWVTPGHGHEAQPVAGHLSELIPGHSHPLSVPRYEMAVRETRLPLPGVLGQAPNLTSLQVADREVTGVPVRDTCVASVLGY